LRNHREHKLNILPQRYYFLDDFSLRRSDEIAKFAEFWVCFQQLKEHFITFAVKFDKVYV